MITESCTRQYIHNSTKSLTLFERPLSKGVLVSQRKIKIIQVLQKNIIISIETDPDCSVSMETCHGNIG